MPHLARHLIGTSAAIGLLVLAACSSDETTSTNGGGSDAGGSSSSGSTSSSGTTTSSSGNTSSSGGSSGENDAASDAPADGSSGGAECTGKTFSASCKIGIQCADFYGMTEQEAAGTCSGAGGTLDKTGKCARTGLSGGCEHSEGNVCTVKWYPSSIPAGTVQAGCKSPDTFRTP